MEETGSKIRNIMNNWLSKIFSKKSVDSNLGTVTIELSDMVTDIPSVFTPENALGTVIFDNKGQAIDKVKSIEVKPITEDGFLMHYEVIVTLIASEVVYNRNNQ